MVLENANRKMQAREAPRPSQRSEFDVRCFSNRARASCSLHFFATFRRIAQNFSPAGVMSPFFARTIPTGTTSVIPSTGL